MIPFDAAPRNEWQVTGNDPKTLDSLLVRIDSSSPGGGTDIYTPVMNALEAFKTRGDLKRYFPAVILMTDGKSNQGAALPDVQQRMQQLGLDGKVPIFAIMFGEADEGQLKGPHLGVEREYQPVVPACIPKGLHSQEGRREVLPRAAVVDRHGQARDAEVGALRPEFS